jgi:type I restriction enzyme S subunit
MELPLRDICEFINGGPWSDSEYTDSGIRVVKVTNMQNGTIVSRKDDDYLPLSKHEKYRKHELKTDDIVIATVGSHPTQPGSVVGRTSLIPASHSGSFLNQNAVCLRVKRSDKFCQRYLFYLSNTVLFKHHIESRARGSANQVRMALGELKKFTADYPSNQIQKKIAAILSAYDELIGCNKRRIALLEKLAEDIYREWFVRFRFPGHDKVKVVKGIPKGWEPQTLGSFAREIKMGVKKKDLTDDEKYLGLEHIPRRSIAIDEWTTASTVDSNKLCFQERDILFGKIRPYLHKVAFAHFSGVCSSDTIVIRPKEKIYEGYLLFTVFSDTFIELATIASKGTKMPRADWEFLKKLDLIVPDRNLLEVYQAQFEEIFSQIVNLLRANELLTSLRDRLLPRLISGNLPVEKLDIQFPPGMAEELKAETKAATHA